MRCQNEIQILRTSQTSRLMCKIIVRPVGRLVGLELMRQDPVLNSHSFNGFDKNVFFNMIIRLKLKSNNYNVRTIKYKQVL